ncbi:DUF6299 family protein [Streptomyces sp. BRA346]|uniref:DUF6299 family protein n=1 Tax=Streptomyces sp. BRA346 TaxID=2878199 RepID=UPI0040635F63
MRNRRRFLGAVTGLLIAAPLAPAAQAAPAPSPAPAPAASSGEAGVPGMPQMRQSLPLPWGNNVTVNRVGYVSSDGTVALSGTYRCLRDGATVPRADILVTLTQGQARYGLGGGPAICDGLTHSWSVQDGAGVRFVPGPALVEGSLLTFEVGQQPIPLPRTAAVGERAIMLEAREL